MTHTFSTNFNTYENQTASAQLIPAGTLAKVVFDIKPGQFGPENLFTQAQSGSVYLNGIFTVLEGPYARRKVFHTIGYHSVQPEDKWGKQGRAFLRTLVDSGRNILPNDNSESAQKQRDLQSFKELIGLVCVVRVGTKPFQQKTPDGPDIQTERNCIMRIITPDQKAYQEVMSGQNTGFNSSTPAPNTPNTPLSNWHYGAK